MPKSEPSYCALCGIPLTEQELEQSRQQAERCNDHLLCVAHQRRFSGCPGLHSHPLRGTPGFDQ